MPKDALIHSIVDSKCLIKSKLLRCKPQNILVFVKLVLVMFGFLILPHRSNHKTQHEPNAQNRTNPPRSIDAAKLL